MVFVKIVWIEKSIQVENKKLDQEPLEEYLVHLKIERDLADNSVESYKRDIQQYSHFLEEQKSFDWDKNDRYDMVLFLQQLKENVTSDNSIIRMTASFR